MSVNGLHVVDAGTLESVGQFQSLKTDAKRRLGKLTSNCYLGSASLGSLIAQQRVRFENRSEGLLIYVDEGAYDRLYYYLGEDSAFPAIEHHKVLVLEELDVNGRMRQRLSMLESALPALGWALEARNLQVSAELAGRAGELHDACASCEAALARQELMFSQCVGELRAATVLLWETHLKLADVPGDHLAFPDDPTQDVICVVDANGALCGVNWWRCSDGVCEIRHTVTSPDHLHRGIGYAVLVYTLNDAAGKGCRRAFTYIDGENHKSLGLYGKAGFVANGRTSTQYVLKPTSSWQAPPSRAASR